MLSVPPFDPGTMRSGDALKECTATVPSLASATARAYCRLRLHSLHWGSSAYFPIKMACRAATVPDPMASPSLSRRKAESAFARMKPAREFLTFFRDEPERGSMLHCIGGSCDVGGAALAVRTSVVVVNSAAYVDEMGETDWPPLLLLLLVALMTTATTCTALLLL